MQEFFQSKVMPAIMGFVNTKAIRAIKDGMVYSMPLIIIGAVFLLLFQLPIEALATMVTNSGAVPFLAHGYTSTFQITALITAIAIAYQWAKNDGWEPLSAGIIACGVFLILIPDVIAGAGPDGADVSGLDKTWLAGQGMIGAMIAGLLTGLIYSKFLQADIRIKMPEGVPDGVAAAFTGLIPAAAMLCGAVVIYGIVWTVSGVTPIELIYKYLQTPLQNVGGSMAGVATFTLLIPFLWWFGVHGATVVGSVSGTIATANLQTNQAIFDELTAQGMSRAEAIAALPDHGAQIYTSAFNNCFGAITGSGITMGLVIFMLFFAKSAQFKQVGKLGIGCGIFNINEPILFGTPIVMNPKLFLPFVAAPFLGVMGAYVLTMIRVIPYTIGVDVPWTTPPILSGLICIGPMAAIWQLAEIAISFFVYLPFAKSLDEEAFQAEQAENAAA